MKQWLDKLQLSRAERNGVLVLAIGLVVMLAVRLWLMHWQPILPAADMASFQKEIAAFEADTLLELNTATAEALEQLPGIGPSMAIKIIAYRNELGGFSYKEQLLNIPGIGESKFNGLTTYIRIDTALTKVIIHKVVETDNGAADNFEKADEPWPIKLRTGEQIELNKATLDQLRQLPGIGLAYAERIANYRNRLGGFYKTEQLREVTGIGEVKYNAMLPYLRLDVKNIKRINVNTADEQSILRHPYAKETWVILLLSNRSYQTIEQIPHEGLDERLLPYLLVD
ncbi:helix-hairpin-helix domain-containing protein [soil metagenome]